VARINKASLALQATDFAYRADYVRRDPAVQKAALQARRVIPQARKSTSEFYWEARSFLALRRWVAGLTPRDHHRGD
jgi:hypothetical protein